jgi:SAM-dependent methyltransferase
VKQGFAPDVRYFQDIYQKHLFGKSTSASGPGSSLDATKAVREAIFELFNEYRIQNIVDIPCGDFLWFRAMEHKNLKYTGLDIVPELISELREEFPEHQFDAHDATSDCLGTYDLILCRDLLVHLTNEQALKVIDNFKNSGSTYLLTTTFVNLERNVELRVPRIGVGWRPLNLAVFPFSLGNPLRTINENSSEGRGRYQDKSLGLWKLN